MQPEPVLRCLPRPDPHAIETVTTLAMRASILLEKLRLAIDASSDPSTAYPLYAFCRQLEADFGVATNRAAQKAEEVIK